MTNPATPKNLKLISSHLFLSSSLLSSFPGDEIVVVIQKARPISNVSPTGSSSGGGGGQKVRRGDVRHAVVVRTKKETQRPDGRIIRFDDNACVLLNNRKEPLGTRINGVVGMELRNKGWGKIVSLAPKVV